MSNTLKTDLRDGVLSLTLNRPDVLNSFNREMAGALQAALSQAASDASTRAVLLTGAGRGFCAGQDLAEALPKDGVMPDLGDFVRTTWNPTIRAIRTLEKPVVCAVNGTAAGAGANLVFANSSQNTGFAAAQNNATGPTDVIRVMKEKRYPCAANGATQSIGFAFIDARYRQQEVYETCLLAPRQIFPVMGVQGRAVRSIEMQQVPGKPEGFGVLKFIKQDAHFDLYIEKVKKQKPPGFYWPENLEEILIREHTAERLVRKKNRVIWEDDHRRPNHYGDATELALCGIDWLTGGRRSRVLADALAAKDEQLTEESYATKTP